jgi:hypothetical protein
VTEADGRQFGPLSANVHLTYDGVQGWQETENNGRWILIIAADGWQIAQLSDVESDLLWLTEPLARAAAVGSTVMPLVWGKVIDPADLTQWVSMTADGQVLVNLGLIHRDNEFIPYWDQWLAWMRSQGWRRFAWYVWDQGPGMPGDWQGRLAPSFEFIFHFNRQTRKPNKTVPCKFAGQETLLRADGSSTAMRGKDGQVNGWTAAGQPTQNHRIPDSVIRVMRHKGKIGQDIDHPAVFPVTLPVEVIEAYTQEGEIVFEPFGGSGTTLMGLLGINE